MAVKKIYHNHHHPCSSKTIILLMLFRLHTITMLTIVESSSEDAKSESSLLISSESSSVESLSKEAAPLLTFLQRSVNNGPLKQSNLDNNAGIDKGRGELHLYPKDNEGDNNDSNVSSEFDSDTGEGLRIRREDTSEPGLTLPGGGNSKVIATNWGTYEEQAPVVVHSGSRTFDSSSTQATDDESSEFGDEYQSKETEDSSEYDDGDSALYDDYEGEHFEGRQFYPNQGGMNDESGDQQEPDGYYRQQYYATVRPLSQQQAAVRGGVPNKQTGYRPGYRNRLGQQRPQYRQPQKQQEDDSTGSGLMDFFQKAKTFYDIFQAMNSAWKTVQDHYRKNGQGVFPGDSKHQNQSTRIDQRTQHFTNNSRKTNTKRFRTTEVPITVTSEEVEREQNQQQDKQQEKDEYRSRRSWLNDTVAVNDMNPTFETNSNEDASEIKQSNLKTDSSSYSASSTDVAEGRYIKGDPLKGYYDFVITEGSYKFWAVFQVGTALLIIYSTFAAIYYSKVNPLVSDYDYVDYLGGGRSLSDDSDFVDMDAPTGAAGNAADGSKMTPPLEGTSRSRQQQESSAGWFGWLPHAGHTLQFILESIDKGYNEE